METYILEFSAESDVAVQNVLESAKGVSKGFEIISREGSIAIVRSDLEIIGEMAFLNFATRVLGEFESPKDLETISFPEGSFHLRVRNYSGGKKFSEAELGRELQGNRTVEFTSPDFVLRAINFNGWHIGILAFQKDSKGMNQRRAPLRPFFSPVTIHPKYARFLVNLSRTEKGELILDPFCGTGGIILEAHLMGRKVIGSDASLNMIKGCRLNMKYFNVDAEILHTDFSNLELESKVDAIVTDLPYGRSSEVSATDIDTLYSEIFPGFHSLLKDGRYISLVVSDMEKLKNASGYFETVSVAEFRQHRSLTRYFVSMRKL